MSKTHASLGASSAHRWMQCGASLRLSALAPKGAGETVYALEGTAAHHLAELVLSRPPHEAAAYVGDVLKVKSEATGELVDFTVDEEMATGVKVFVDLVRNRVGKRWIEKTFTLSDLNPPDDMFGTADAVTFHKQGRTLFVDDLKYGKGKLVYAANNPQLRYYGLGALLEIEKEIGPGQIDTIVLTICQPRIDNVTTETVSYFELLDFAGELLEAAAKALRPDAPAVPGDWCSFCKGAPYCPAKMDQAIAAAKIEFSRAGMSLAKPSVSLPQPGALTDEERRKIFAVMDQIEDWFKALREWEKGELLAGREVPGRKLVQGRQGNRMWKDEQEAIAFLKHVGYTEAQLMVTELRSPAQLEKVRKGKVPDHLIVRGAPGLSVVDADDPRPAFQQAQEFAAIPAGGSASPSITDLI